MQTMVECDILPVLLKKEKAICFKDIVSHLKGLGNRKNFFPTLLQFARYCWYTQPPLLQPIVAFLVARRIKTWMCSKMVPHRFNSVTVLHSHNRMTDEIDLKNIANDFASKNDRRIRMFGCFKSLISFLVT